MKLLSSLKPKKRYLVFEIISDKKNDLKEIEVVVNDALSSFLGQLGLSKATPLLIKEKFANQRFILKVNHKYVDEVKSALTLIKNIKNNPVICKSIITTGTIKKANQYLIKRN